MFVFSNYNDSAVNYMVIAERRNVMKSVGAILSVPQDSLEMVVISSLLAKTHHLDSCVLILFTPSSGSGSGCLQIWM